MLLEGLDDELAGDELEDLDDKLVSGDELDALELDDVEAVDDVLHGPSRGPEVPPRDAGAREQYSASMMLVWSGPSATGPQTPVEDIEKPWIVTLKQQTVPSVGIIRVSIRYGAGEQNFSRLVTLTGTSQIRVPVTARAIEISADWTGGSPASPPSAPVQVFVSIGEGAQNITPTDWYAPVYLGGTTASSDHGSADVGAGTLLEFCLSILTVPTAPGNHIFCLMLFDSAAAGLPTTGTVPLLASPPLFGLGSVQWTDEGSPVIRYANGLLWALSSTFDTFTPCGAGGACRADLTKGN